MDLVRIRAARSRLPAQDALASKNLYVGVSIQLTADGLSQLSVVQLQLLSNAVEHRKVAGRLVGSPCSNYDFAIDSQPRKEVSATPGLKTKFSYQPIELMGG
jgi:hypothetical protein